jgi:hypothetical protein
MTTKTTQLETMINGEPYLKAEKAQEILQMTYSALRNQVIAGHIKKSFPPGSKQAYYSKKDVEDLAEARGLISLYKNLESTEKPVVRPARGIDDIRETVRIAQQHFGENAYDLEARMERFRRVPNGDYVLEHNRVIVGYFTIQGTKPNTIQNVFDRKQGARVHLEDIEPIEPDKPVDIYVSGIATRKGTNRTETKRYGTLLVLGMLNTLVKFGKEGIEVHAIWGKSRTVSGIKLSRDLGLKELGYIDNEQTAFLLDTDPQKAAHPLVKLYLQRYQDAINQRKALK